MKKITFAVCALLFTFALHAAQVTTVILVRHAEKASQSMNDDPPLTEEGAARAKRLATMLASSGITAIYTTPFTRTRDTAAPLATALKITPVEVKTGPTYADEMATILRDKKHAGGTVLVVGHSNSTQAVMKALGIANAPKIEDPEYDNLFIVTLAEGHDPKMVVLKF